MKAKGSSQPKRKRQPSRQKATAKTAKPKKSSRSLQDVVGPLVYQTWVAMLRALVPEGRTHRLAPLVAAMLQYAFSVAQEGSEEDTDENSVSQSLIDSAEAFEPEDVKAVLHDVVARLFKDAGAAFNRMSARGEQYSIVDEAYAEYIHWFDMPWDW
jgi:hypothetical protein